MRDETIELLQDIRAYTRSRAAASSKEVASKIIASSKEVASKIIDTREKAEVYERLDGKRTHKEISRLIGVPRKTVTNWVREFVVSGLAVNLPGSNDRALFTLAELNISVRSLKRRGRNLKSK